MKQDERGFKFIEGPDDWRVCVRNMYDDILLLYDMIKKLMGEKDGQAVRIHEGKVEGIAGNTENNDRD